MITIRRNVFETNSSMMHNLTLLSDDEYKKINDGKAFIVGDAYINFEMFYERFKEYNKEENLNEKDAKEAFEFFSFAFKILAENTDEYDFFSFSNNCKFRDSEELDLFCRENSFNEDDEKKLRKMFKKLSKAQLAFIEYIIDEDPQDIDTYFYGYEDGTSGEKTVKGITVHALSRCGHD